MTFTPPKLPDEVANTYNNYPAPIREKLLAIRQMIFALAAQNTLTGAVEESLKWGEPSYLTKTGSTIRLAWHDKTPEQFGVFFNCNSKLIPTFREIYPNAFNYQGKRAIIFTQTQDIPTQALQHCLELALSYHKIKHLPLLGV